MRVLFIAVGLEALGKIKVIRGPSHIGLVGNKGADSWAEKGMVLHPFNACRLTKQQQPGKNRSTVAEAPPSATMGSPGLDIRANA